MFYEKIVYDDILMSKK